MDRSVGSVHKLKVGVEQIGSPRRLDLVISVCHQDAIDVWERSARGVTRWIEADRYQVIVPDDQVELFRTRSPAIYDCLPESSFCAGLAKELRQRIESTGNLARYGWYLQQFIKLSALSQLQPEQVGLIWDADTVPLRPLHFVDQSGLVQHFVGEERHSPYFDCISRLLGLTAQLDKSFIAQSLPVKGRWFTGFCKHLEGRHHCEWQEALLRCIDFSQGSGFSEYETLGTFCTAFFPNELRPCHDAWERLGNSLIGGVEQLGSPRSRELIQGNSFISFESWDVGLKPTLSRHFIRRMYAQTMASFRSRMAQRVKRGNSRGATVATFLEEYFQNSDFKSIVQVGANDGVQNDPLRRWLERPGHYRATLIEPLPLYADRLRSLYAHREDIQIVQKACGQICGTAQVHYIPPETAAQMNGDGPPNDWAHGQGSFDRSTVEHWIRANAFRGAEYRARLDEFIGSILTIPVDVIPVGQVLERCANSLLCIDVQGAELNVILGVDWRVPPRYVIYEDDRQTNANIERVLVSLGYRYVCGDSDKVFEIAPL